MPPINGMHSAAAALRYWERKQEVVANNLANVSTDGFKAQRVFATLLDGIRPVARTSSDLSTGTLKQTGNLMDVAISGDGFFVVSTPAGERYTRGGTLHIDDKHRLVDIEGRPLLGTKKNEPLTLTDGPIEITSSGEVKQNGQIVDVLRMEGAPKDAELQREGEALWIPPTTRTVIKPEARNIEQGHLEESNVNSMSALVDMVVVQRAYASVQKSIVEMDRTNQTIVTDLAKPL
ncbi:MAG TPA: flagellar hook basal-body protein [Gemmatimonadaceae bacterium]